MLTNWREKYFWLPNYSSLDDGQAIRRLRQQQVQLCERVVSSKYRQAGFDHDALADALGVPPTHQLLTGIAVGMPGDPADVDERTAARDHRDRVRRPLAEWAFGGGFGEPWMPDRLADSGA